MKTYFHVVDGEIYSLRKENTIRGINYYCCKKKTKSNNMCKARGKLEDGGIFKLTKIHTCDGISEIENIFTSEHLKVLDTLINDNRLKTSKVLDIFRSTFKNDDNIQKISYSLCLKNM